LAVFLKTERERERERAGQDRKGGRDRIGRGGTEGGRGEGKGEMRSMRWSS
jgi:hypothetical protein